MKKGQIALISGALLLFVALLFAKTKGPAKTEDVPQVAAASVSLEGLAEAASKDLSETAVAEYNTYKASLGTGTKEQQISTLDSMIKLADVAGKPLMAAHYSNKKAELINSSEAWFKTADRSFYSTKFVKTEEDRKALFNAAIASYDKGLNIEPSNTDAKINQAVCFVEATPDPMKGINILKEIVEKDSTNINAQMNLGLLAIKSGQFDKAIERFEKILTINPNQTDTYLYLADAYERNGNKKGAVAALQKYVDLTDDVTIKTEVNSYINKLKNS